MNSAGSIALRQRYTDLFEDRLAFLDEILDANYDHPSLTYQRSFNVRDSSRAYEEITGLTGYGQYTQKAEGETLDYDTKLQGYDKRFTHVTFAKGSQISFEAMDDDIDNAISNSLPMLGRAAQVSIETYIYNVINNGFATETTPDGSYIFSDSHPLVGGGTADNLITGDLSIANLEAALNLFNASVDDRNMPIDVVPQALLIHPDLQWLAGEIIKSTLRSDTANNPINMLNGILQIYTSRYLTSTENWFVHSVPNQHRILVYWRQEPESDHGLDFDTKNMKSSMLYRLSAGAADWRGWVGGNGA